MDKKKLSIGFLTLIVFSSFLYIQLNEDVRIRVDDDKSTFYVPHEDYSWIWTVSGREENRLFDGSSILYRDKAGIEVSRRIEGDEVWITRTTPYQRGPVVKDIYYFRGNETEEELFPISHTVRVLNGSDFFYRYTVDDLSETGEKRKLDGETELSFGKNMNVELNPGYRWAWVGWPYGDDSVSAQYDLDSDNESFNVRLFDPPTDWTIDGNRVYVNDSQAYISAKPHTVGRNGEVQFKIRTKSYSGGVNAVFGFDTSQVTPQSLSLQTGTDIVSEDYYYVAENVSSYEATTADCEVGIGSNRMNATHTNGTSTVYCYDSANSLGGGSYNLSWTTTHEEPVWSRLSYDVHKKIAFDNKTDWYAFTGRNVTAGETYTLKMELDVPEGAEGKYDFALYPSSYGSDVVSAYNDGVLYLLDPWYDDEADLVTYYDWHEGSGSTLVDLKDAYNGSIVDDDTHFNDTTYPTFGNTGNGSNYSGDFDGTNDYVDTSGLGASSSTGYTYSFWVRIESMDNDDYFSHQYRSSSPGYDCQLKKFSDDFIVQCHDGSDSFHEYVSMPSFDTWHHIAASLSFGESDGIKTYIDGELQTPTSSSDSNPTSNDLGGDSTDNAIGSKSDGTDGYFDGQIDEFMLFDRNLTESEIENLYNYSQTTTPESDNPPTVSLVSPDDAASVNADDVLFQANASDDKSLNNVSLLLNGVIEATNTSGYNGTYNFTQNLSIGSYNWSVKACDNADQCTTPANRTLTATDYINGTVYLEDGSTVENATVYITRQNTNVTYNLSTDSSGYFRQNITISDNYTVSAHFNSSLYPDVEAFVEVT